MLALRQIVSVDEAMKAAFFDKLIDRLDRLDPASLQTHFLRLAQERGLLETIFQSIQEGVLVVDGNGNLTYANRAAEEFLGFSWETARGRPVLNYLREIDWERVLALDESEWSRLITQEIEVSYPEHRFLTFYVVPLSLDDNGESGALLMLRDVTRERQQEETLLESERFNAIKLLAAGVAHEIGNPLNALNIHLQLLERELNVVAEEQRAPLAELVDIARKEVMRLDLIITQFLHAIRPGSPQMAPCRIDALLTETLTLLREEIQNRNIEVEIDQPKALPEIRVDADQIKQSFFNVMKNAFQAMPDGGRLNISFACSSDFLAISFQDTGMGIDTANLGRVFEPYHTTRPGGSGLGLMIVQRIVREHGGQIELASKPNEGTVVVIKLPLPERRMRLLNAPERRPPPAPPPGIDTEDA
jgi:PAS domain S-box-containing protein